MSRWITLVMLGGSVGGCSLLRLVIPAAGGTGNPPVPETPTPRWVPEIGAVLGSAAALGAAAWWRKRKRNKK